MINQIVAIAIKEIKILLHDRGSILALFILPVAFILVMTIALEGVFTTGSEDRPIVMMVSNQDQGELAENVLQDLRQVSGLTLVETIDGQKLTSQSIEEQIIERKYLLGLVFPADFSMRVLQDEAAPLSVKPATIQFIVDPTVTSQVLSPTRGMVEGYVERITSFAKMEVQTKNGFSEMVREAPANQQGFIRQISERFEAGQSSAEIRSGVEYQVVSPALYQIKVEPSSVEQNVPAYTIYGVFFIMQTIATSFFREKNNGTFRRLQAAPLSKSAYLIGKSLSYYAVNLIQIVLMFTVGVLVFHLNLGNSPQALVVISLVISAAATGMGMMVACLVKSLEQASSLSTMLGVVLSVIGGMMVPVYVMPEFMQKFAWFTPHAWALSAYQDIIVRGLQLSNTLPTLGVLMLFTLAFWGIAVWRFKFE